MVAPSEILLYKHKDLSLVPTTHGRKAAPAGLTCSPALGRQRQLDPWSSLAGQASLLCEFQVSEILPHKTG